MRAAGVPVPLARTTRPAWPLLPEALRAAVEDVADAPVVAAHTQSTGFSSGAAVRLRFADGARLFVKAMPTIGQPSTLELYRAEAAAAAALPAAAPAPRFVAHLAVAGWVLLAFEDVPGQVVPVPWSAPDTALVVAALTDMGKRCPTGGADANLAPWGGEARCWPGWADLLAAGRADELDTWCRANADRLVAAEAAYPSATAGSALVHSDLRSDNIIIGRTVTFVDWAWAARGAPWLDPLILALTGTVQGMADPEEVFAAHPDAAAADPDAVSSALAALAGRFVNASGRPAPAGFAGLRRFQRAEARVAVEWLARRTGWR